MMSDEKNHTVARERLQKYLARAGVASRRAAEALIRQGRVSVNGVTVTSLGTKVGPGDEVVVDGHPVALPQELVYLALNKPAGYVTTAYDPWGRPTVMQLVRVPQRVYPVGRLDVDSEGLLILTNDGQLAYHLTHPRYGVEKEYHVLVEGRPTENTLERLRQGIELEGRKTAPARVSRLQSDGQGTWLSIVIHEGRKRQVRRMLEEVGHRVLCLIRVRFGPVHLDGLPVGAFRRLTQAEVGALKAEVER